MLLFYLLLVVTSVLAKHSSKHKTSSQPPPPPPPRVSTQTIPATTSTTVVVLMSTHTVSPSCYSPEITTTILQSFSITKPTIVFTINKTVEGVYTVPAPHGFEPIEDTLSNVMLTNVNATKLDPNHIDRNDRRRSLQPQAAGQAVRNAEHDTERHTGTSAITLLRTTTTTLICPNYATPHVTSSIWDYIQTSVTTTYTITSYTSTVYEACATNNMIDKFEDTFIVQAFQDSNLNDAARIGHTGRDTDNAYDCCVRALNVTNASGWQWTETGFKAGNCAIYVVTTCAPRHSNGFSLLAANGYRSQMIHGNGPCGRFQDIGMSDGHGDDIPDLDSNDGFYFPP